jgi:PAS domain-containing protein
MQSSTAPSSSSPPFFSSQSWKRFQNDALPHIPILTLNREGTIQTLTPAARQVLEYGSDMSLDDCFFTHVHKHNMRRVMQDLADMVSRGKQRTQWLLRLRTGNERWRWYRAAVRNNLGRQEDHIRIRLRPL